MARLWPIFARISHQTRRAIWRLRTRARPIGILTVSARFSRPFPGRFRTRTPTITSRLFSYRLMIIRISVLRNTTRAAPRLLLSLPAFRPAVCLTTRLTTGASRPATIEKRLLFRPGQPKLLSRQRLTHGHRRTSLSCLIRRRSARILFLGATRIRTAILSERDVLTAATTPFLAAIIIGQWRILLRQCRKRRPLQFRSLFRSIRPEERKLI